MRINKRWTIVAMGLLVLTCGAWLVWAGPVLPGAQRLPAEVEAMTGLERFRVRTGMLIGKPSEVTVTKEKLTKELRQRLTEHGLELGTDEERRLPLVSLDINFATDPDLPDVLSVTAVISLYQEVTIDRLDRKLVLPTASVVAARLTTMGNAEEAVTLAMQSCASTFATTLRMAEAHERVTRPRTDGAKP